MQHVSWSSRNWKASSLITLVVTLAVLGGCKKSDDPHEKAKPPVPVNVATVTMQDVPYSLSGLGNVLALNEALIRPQIDGLLTAVHFKEGQTVQAGTLLASIDDRSIAANLAQARAEKARNTALLEAAEADLKRFQELAQKNLVARQSLDQQTAQVGQLCAAIKGNDAAIAAAGVQLSYTRITSPLNGRVGIRHVDPGNVVRSSDTQGLVTVTQMSPIAVLFSLPQGSLGQIQPLLGQQAEVIAYERDGGQELARGTLQTVDNHIDSTTGTIKLKATFPNTPERLWPGQFVTIQLRVATQKGALVVPVRALQQGRDQPFVYRIKGGKAEAVNVKTGISTEDVATITEGLALGDQVVVDGQSRLKPGAEVKVVGPETGKAATQAQKP